MMEPFARWLRDRREVNMRAPDYACYLRELHGDAAVKVAERAVRESHPGSYRWRLYRRVVAELAS